MSIVKTSDVFCDRCGDWERGGVDVNAGVARRRARESGWTRERGQDVCPVCNGSAYGRANNGAEWLMKAGRAAS